MLETNKWCAPEKVVRHAARRKLVRMVEKSKGMCIWATGEAVSLRLASSPSN
jgi:hypothetical protein